MNEYDFHFVTVYGGIRQLNKAGFTRRDIQTQYERCGKFSRRICFVNVYPETKELCEKEFHRLQGLGLKAVIRYHAS